MVHTAFNCDSQVLHVNINKRNHLVKKFGRELVGFSILHKISNMERVETITLFAQ